VQQSNPYKKKKNSKINCSSDFGYERLPKEGQR